MKSVPVLKDEEHAHPVPLQWRSKLREIVGALRNRNYNLDGLADVDALNQSTAVRIAANIENYGCTLASLFEESWNTSVCQWQSDHWEVLVDLFTEEEGGSDLVLHVYVSEESSRFVFNVCGVYVP